MCDRMPISNVTSNQITVTWLHIVVPKPPFVHLVVHGHMISKGLKGLLLEPVTPKDPSAKGLYLAPERQKFCDVLLLEACLAQHV